MSQVLTDPVARGKAWLEHEAAVAEVMDKNGVGKEPGTPERASKLKRALKKLYVKRMELLGV